MNHYPDYRRRGVVCAIIIKARSPLPSSFSLGTPGHRFVSWSFHLSLLLSIILSLYQSVSCASLVEGYFWSKKAQSSERISQTQGTSASSQHPSELSPSPGFQPWHFVLDNVLTHKRPKSVKRMAGRTDGRTHALASHFPGKLCSPPRTVH